ncbi:hypothetical protein ABBQ38_015411 [Trebouxia sp. C0009 RCD-2024]
MHERVLGTSVPTAHGQPFPVFAMSPPRGPLWLLQFIDRASVIVRDLRTYQIALEAEPCQEVAVRL